MACRQILFLKKNAFSAKVQIGRTSQRDRRKRNRYFDTNS